MKNSPSITGLKNLVYKIEIFCLYVSVAATLFFIVAFFLEHKISCIQSDSYDALLYILGSFNFIGWILSYVFFVALRSDENYSSNPLWKIFFGYLIFYIIIVVLIGFIDFDHNCTGAHASWVEYFRSFDL